jgi:DNA-binding response OmpR family regulator
MRILIVEDDTTIAANLRSILSHDSYAADIAPDGETALQHIFGEEYDLLIIDWMLPDISGPDIIRQIRADKNMVPILLLTAKSQSQDIIQGLDSGADDYLTKPFQMGELLARVRSLLRRSPLSMPDPTIKVGTLIVDTNLHRVTVNNKDIDLTPKEYALLEYMARNINHSLSRLEILSHVWDSNADELSNTVDVHIRYLRAKIGPKFIQTIKGKGYVLCIPNP